MVVPEVFAYGESTQDQMIPARQGIKYLPPDLIVLENVHPTKEMKDFFWEHMEFDHMTGGLMTAWDMLVDMDA